MTLLNGITVEIRSLDYDSGLVTVADGAGHASEVSVHCAPGGNGQCDGYTDTDGFCECECHQALSLPQRATSMQRWHDLLNGYRRPQRSTCPLQHAHDPHVLTVNLGEPFACSGWEA